MPRLPDTITFSEIADALDTLVDISDRMDELADHNASFWRDAAACLRRLDEAGRGVGLDRHVAGDFGG